MECSRCSEAAVPMDVPSSLASHAPASTVAVCSTCLELEPAEAASGDDTIDRVSTALPSGEAGVAALLLVDALDSLATNRESIEALVAVLERGGSDPLLVLDRLASDPDLDPAVDLERRSRQLEQLVL